VVFFHPASRTLVFTDLAFNVRRGGPDLARIPQWDIDRVMVSHGDLLETDGKRQVALACAFLR
jgi:hypothetical protein